jgi:hypothetical protein
VEVTDTPITTLHQYGFEIVLSIVIHELGHHLLDFAVRGFSSVAGRARAAGVNMIFNVLLDERLERGLRARRPAWGGLFDRAISYAFAGNRHRLTVGQYAGFVKRSPSSVLAAVEAGTLPGTLRRHGGRVLVELRDRDLFRIPGALPPLAAFLTALRCGFRVEEHPDPAVAAALKLVPGNLKDLTHEEVLRLAEQITRHIGRDEGHGRDLQRLRAMARRQCAIARAIARALGRLCGTAIAPHEVRGLAPRPMWGGSERQWPRRTCARRRGPRGLRGPKRPGGQSINRGPDRSFQPLDHEQVVAFDPSQHARVVDGIQAQIRGLRRYLAQLGDGLVPVYGARSGRRVDIPQARRAAVVPTARLFIGARREPVPDLYLGILIDRSGSMAGEKLARARAFGALVAEAAKGIPGIEGHVSAFDDDTFYRLGSFRRNAVAALEAGGGNNDAGGLARAAQLAAASRRRQRLIVMISDGSPTECTVEAVRHQVRLLARDRGIACVHVSVGRGGEVAFPQHVDLSAYPFDEAVRRFGALLMRLTGARR